MHYLTLYAALHHLACDAACHSRRVNSRAMHADWHKAMADFGRGGVAGIFEFCAAVFALVLLYRAQNRA